MNILEFISASNENRVIAFVLAVIAAVVITVIVANLIHALTIWFRGYPPEHCDVSGEAVIRDDDGPD